ncbi:MAG: extracellular solute-binding protein [Alphaproteobacteria bacterium]|nr:extracellular solute-binding protein [Alphaproteobacteria bacterium]
MTKRLGTPTIITRRDALKGGAAAVAGASALGIFGPTGQALAQNKKVVLGTWGGDYSKLLAKNISTPLMAPKGWEMVHDDLGSQQRKTKVQAEARLPKGTSDIQALADTDIGELTQLGLLEKLDPSKFPNSKNILKNFSVDKGSYISPHIYSGKVVLYNPKMIPTPPTKIADLWDPKHQGKVGVIDIQFNYTTMAAALAGGGKTGDFETAKKMLLELKKLKPRIYPTNEALAQGLKTEEIGLCIMWKARAVQWQNAGIPVQTVAPKDGIITYMSGFTIPKNAPNKEGAYAFLNAALEPSAQEAFAVDMGYNPVVSNAKVAPDLRKRIGFSEEEAALLVNPDLEFLTKKGPDLRDFWDKQFKA